MSDNAYVEALAGRPSMYSAREAARAADRLIDNAEVVDGVLRWATGNVPPRDIVALAKAVGIKFDVAKTEAAREADLAAMIADMRANDAPMSDEERFEARAAFGEGTEIVNIITGRVTRL